MATKIIKNIHKTQYFEINSLLFLPPKPEQKPYWAIFTHGYSANKADCINWASRLADNGIPTLIFDLPGHYLGSYNEVESFEVFKTNAHKLFLEMYSELENHTQKPNKLILGGHSLGALLSIKALEIDFGVETLAIGVGIGISQHKNVHLFESSFYEKTLNIRRQLVSPAIDSDKMFPWIKEEKHRLHMSGKRIHLITGENDVVVGEGGAKVFEEMLADDNDVSLHEPKNLAHHEPSLAAPHIYHFLKKELNL